MCQKIEMIVAIPFVNGLGKTKGCTLGPKEIIKKLKKRKIREVLVDNTNIEESSEKIYREAKKFFKTKEKIIFVGGDHSISYPIARAFSESFGGKKTLIVFDAHADCMKPIKEPTNEEWLRAVIEEKLFEKIFLCGTRKFEPQEKKFLEKAKEVKVLHVGEFGKTLDVEKIYLSIDVDVFDSKIVPATNYPEAGGISKKNFFDFVRKIKDKIIAADIVEIDPEKDLNNKTINLASGIIKYLEK